MDLNKVLDGDKIRKAAAVKGMNIRQLAEKCETSPQNLHRIINGGDLMLTLTLRLSDALDVRPRDILSESALERFGHLYADVATENSQAVIRNLLELINEKNKVIESLKKQLNERKND